MSSSAKTFLERVGWTEVIFEMRIEKIESDQIRKIPSAPLHIKFLSSNKLSSKKRILTFLACSLACFLNAKKLSSVDEVKLAFTGVGVDVPSTGAVWASDDHELALLIFWSTGWNHRKGNHIFQLRVHPSCPFQHLKSTSKSFSNTTR